MTTDASRWLQEGPRGPKRASRGAQERPKRAPRAPKKAPRDPQDTPKRATRGPKRAPEDALGGPGPQGNPWAALDFEPLRPFELSRPQTPGEAQGTPGSPRPWTPGGPRRAPHADRGVLGREASSLPSKRPLFLSSWILILARRASSTALLAALVVSLTALGYLLGHVLVECLVDGLVL